MFPSHDPGGPSMGPINPNYQPAGLSQGYANDGLFGQMTFSSVSDQPIANNQTNQFGPGSDIVFKSKIQQPGTLFRFAADPDQIVYRILSNSQDITAYYVNASPSLYNDEAAMDSYTSEGNHRHKGPINIGTEANGYDRDWETI